ncbi:MAG TPA: DUF2461 domain-containing protein [Bacteroidia bacterium]|nr:DUF2461 domain-containing protein [Bacteroidia bacterium]
MIKKETLGFLSRLKKNNNRDWFEKNKQLYLDAKENVENTVEEIIAEVRKIDRRIPAELSARKCMFRIYRDIRFSKDKRPYKTNMGAMINPGGKMASVPGYYIHFEPGRTFLAGGIYMPGPAELAKIRQEIDYNFRDFKKIVSDKSFKKYFGELDQDDKLVTTPKGYAKDHPAIEFLKLKSFIVVAEISEKDTLSKNFAKTVAPVFKAMQPLHKFLQQAVD